MNTLRRLAAHVPHWCRVVMERDIRAELGQLPLAELDAMEVSGQRRSRVGFKTWRSTTYPAFDLCSTKPITPLADVVFCEQVLEHVRHPMRAAENLFRLTRPGGMAIVSVPFMLRVHREPEDYWRFSVAGLRALLEDAGFVRIRVESWGNRSCVLMNLWFWWPYIPLLNGMGNTPSTPVIVWAFAHRAP